MVRQGEPRVEYQIDQDSARPWHAGGSGHATLASALERNRLRTKQRLTWSGQVARSPHEDCVVIKLSIHQIVA